MKNEFENKLREQIINLSYRHEKLFKEPLIKEDIDIKNDSIEAILDDLSLVNDFFIDEWLEELYDDEEELRDYYNNLREEIERIFFNVLLTN